MSHPHQAADPMWRLCTRRVSLTGMLVLPWWLSACSDQSPPTVAGVRYQSQSAVPGAIYRLAVHPLHNPTQLARAFQPLVDRINAHLPGGKVVLESSLDYQAFERKFRAREPHLLLPNPWQTIEAVKVGYRVVATAGDNADFRGVFLVRKGSPLRRPTDVRGKTLSYPSRTALAAAMMPQYFLYEAGVDVERETNSIYVGSQESSILHVQRGLVDVGVTWIPPWRLFQQQHPDLARDLNAIWETPPLVNNSVMVRDDVPASVVEVLQNVLFRLSEDPGGAEVLAASQTRAYRPAGNPDYAPVAEFIRRFERHVRPIE